MKTTAVLLKVTHDPQLPWWLSLGLPAPYLWGDDRSSAYVVRTQQLIEPPKVAKVAA